MSRIGLLLIATGKYDIFVEPLITSAEKFFFPGEPVDIYLFADKPYNGQHSDRMKLQVLEIQHHSFPYATLYRYLHFIKFSDVLTSDYLFYLDVDMRFVGKVGEEIFPGESGLTATVHPGFWKGGGSWDENMQSNAFVPKEKQRKYYAGGFQGGERNTYLKECDSMNNAITDDQIRGVMPVWHDESIWNKLLSERAPKELDPGYCYPEAGWAKGMPFVKRIMALDKDHTSMRK